ncbi:hypothetical protein H3Z85_08685 [Chryseobacterium indologenes]|uniref:hypothetical protein n=1 Tax=Chryseobacterium TaxID=59732 RepID=UPI0003E07A1A|nr:MULTISPECIES: hypothetical protein [Chryseobacterium]MBF6646483.1 hypothetical protein [Chryseobacterium indologenes]MBU3049175.1 hypothetical protein [Chryseobacterium indologenes]MEB4761980.1 hypothetical protein [Chryseobacterium indologenes]QIX80710.1 hypothetical protein FOB56_05440 [Chryseobacterium indologenes]QPQ53390.1 hypothetical protein H3Z85_08685 [Chryseobacterium indologenes]
MKKISLKHLKSGVNEKLSREQLKNLFGGLHDPTDQYCGGGDMCHSNSECPEGTACGIFYSCLRCLKI